MAKRQYNNDFVSMTGALGILNKPALNYWFKSNTAAFCDAESKRGKEVGKTIHEAFQSNIELKEVKIETEYPNEVTNVLKGFMLFKKEHPEIKLRRSEIEMVCEKYRVNGTLDVLCEENNETGVTDWKSTKLDKKTGLVKIYPEYLWQTSGYSIIYEEIYKKRVNFAYAVAFAKDAVAYAIQKIEREEIVAHFENIVLPCIQIYYHQKRK